MTCQFNKNHKDLNKNYYEEEKSNIFQLNLYGVNRCSCTYGKEKIP